MDTVKAKANAVYKKAMNKPYAIIDEAYEKVLKFLLKEIEEHTEEKKYIVEVLNEAWDRLFSKDNSNVFEKDNFLEYKFWMLFENYNIHLLDFSYLKLRKLARAMNSAIVLNEYSPIEKITTTEHIDEIICSLKNIQYFLSYFNCKTVKDLFSEFERTFEIFNNELTKLDYFKYDDEDSWRENHYGIADECKNIYWLRQEIMQLISDYKKYIK